MHADTDSATFTAGCFRPDPERGNPARMLAAHAATETKMTLRNGEQVLLTLLIPIVALVLLSTVHLIDLPEPRANIVTPSVLALAVMSTAFTGQAIALGFDRRYGVIKRLTATALPRWTLISGRVLAALVVVAVQTIVLSIVAFALGWSPAASGLLWMVPLLVLGTLAFGALGVLIGGALRAEIVLAVANTAWFVLAAGLGLALPGAGLSGPLAIVASLLPSDALARALEATLVHGGAPGFEQIVVLLAWGVLGGLAAVRTTRLT